MELRTCIQYRMSYTWNLQGIQSRAEPCGEAEPTSGAVRCAPSSASLPAIALRPRLGGLAAVWGHETSRCHATRQEGAEIG